MKHFCRCSFNNSQILVSDYLASIANDKTPIKEPTNKLRVRNRFSFFIILSNEKKIQLIYFFLDRLNNNICLHSNHRPNSWSFPNPTKSSQIQVPQKNAAQFSRHSKSFNFFFFLFIFFFIKEINSIVIATLMSVARTTASIRTIFRFTETARSACRSKIRTRAATRTRAPTRAINNFRLLSTTDTIRLPKKKRRKEYFITLRL